LFTVSAALGAQTSPSREATSTGQLTILVTDENGVAVEGARVLLRGPSGTLPCESDRAGRCQFSNLAGSPWQLHVEKEDFYVLDRKSIETSGTLEVVLSHQQEVHEIVNVVESTPAIDLAQVSSNEQLSGIDILNIPYPNTRDYRFALSFIPGVIMDQSSQIHVAGAETSQTVTMLDDFNVTQPANGQLLIRVSTDAIRRVSIETSRLPAQVGKTAAGVLGIETGIGDDHYRFAATNFIPSVQNKKGWTLDKVDPRLTFSGPIQKGRAWFFDGIDGEYDNVIIPELPPGEDTDHIWRFGNIAKVQANLAPHDILSTSFLINQLHDEHQGFSTIAPATTRPIDSENLYFASIKDQHSLSTESLLEAGFAFVQYGQSQRPWGSLPYVLTPQIAMGNYYLRQHTTARRYQAITNLYTSTSWHGRHDFTFGVDLDRLSYAQLFDRAPISSLRNCPPGSGICHPLALYSTFTGGGPSTTYNLEASLYAQDRWSPFSRLLIVPGVRFDWDEIIRRPLVSPRLAGTYALRNSGNTKLSAGIDVLYQLSNLGLIAAAQGGTRYDTFYSQPGQPSSFVSTFNADRGHLLAPRFITWSIALEQKLPAQIFLKTEFIRRNGIQDFVYNLSGGASSTNFLLENTRQDHYYSFKVNLRRTFRQRYTIFGSYERSSTTSNQVLDYSLDNLTLSPQVAGPFPWDAPNRVISWGIFPLTRGFDLAYSYEARTGFPFAAINDQQQIVRPPGTYRFPTYETLNLHVEKRFHAAGFYWALRGGFDNITNRQNAFTVNNNINSPQFLTFSNFDRRAFTARIRFLGRK
jgi:hypothetical protein